MITQFFMLADQFVDSMWLMIGFPVIILLGLYFTYVSRAVQFRKFPQVLRIFFKYMKTSSTEGKTSESGENPLHMFFAALGGCIGIGNVVGVCTAVQIGGPGAVFWIWVVALLGMLLKYCEVYLGLKTRVCDSNGNYNGGPMYYLQRAFSSSWIPKLAAILLCIYGVEVYIFNTVVETFVSNWSFNKELTVLFLLITVLYSVAGGLQRIGKVSTVVVPVFVLVFISMCFWILALNIPAIPGIFYEVVRSAFAGHAPIGGFAGCTAMVAITQGISWGCYSGDIGIGYASIIHSESKEQKPERQAALTIFGIFLDTLLVCTMSLTMILLSGTWKESIPTLLQVQSSLAAYFPATNFFMPILFALLGYSTITAFFAVGLKAANFLGGRKAQIAYFVYGIIALSMFSYVDPEQAAVLMRLAGFALLVLNLLAFFKLRKEISFDF
jgi:AGCS family alanine or glycine:cation symporter